MMSLKDAFNQMVKEKEETAAKEKQKVLTIMMSNNKTDIEINRLLKRSMELGAKIRDTKDVEIIPSLIIEKRNIDETIRQLEGRHDHE